MEENSELENKKIQTTNSKNIEVAECIRPF